jgi:hypothetical protein
MSRSMLWSIVTFTLLAFLAMILFLWVREGSLTGAGAVMDKFLGHAGADIVEGGGSVVTATGDAVNRATDGDDGT